MIATRLARRAARRFLLLVCGAGLGADAAAQPAMPSGPIALADGRVTIGGDVSASYGSSDPGFFNYTDYDHSALRTVRFNVAASVKANDHLAILGDVLAENLDSIRAYALYARVRPWTGRAVDVQIGRVPPTFGAFARRPYVADNPLIGYPLAYQYLTSLRPDALPASADELLRKRSFGWRVSYSVGNTAPDRGVPLVSAFRWDTGVQVHAAFNDGRLMTTGSITAGTLSNPRFTDDNDGRQAAGRVEWRPSPALSVGTSFARGAFVTKAAARSALAETRSNDFRQVAWGVDAEFARDYLLLRAETIVSSWHLPIISSPTLILPLRAASLSLEGRYKLRPGLYAAARVDHLGFSAIAGTQTTAPWDAPVTRVEVGGGYSIVRNVLTKLSFQHNARDGGRLVTSANQVATQVVLWF